MGLPQRRLYVTNIGEDGDGNIFFSCWKPPKNKNGKYYHPSEQCIGLDMFIPNVIGLKEDEGTVPVKVVASDKETGLWLVCFDDYFANEQHLYNYKPKTFVNEYGHFKVDYNYEMEDEDNSISKWSIHVGSDIKMVAGDGPIPVTLERCAEEEQIPNYNKFTKKKKLVFGKNLA